MLVLLASLLILASVYSFYVSVISKCI